MTTTPSLASSSTYDSVEDCISADGEIVLPHVGLHAELAALRETDAAHAAGDPGGAVTQVPLVIVVHDHDAHVHQDRDGQLQHRHPGELPATD